MADKGVMPRRPRVHNSAGSESEAAPSLGANGRLVGLGCALRHPACALGVVEHVCCGEGEPVSADLTRRDRLAVGDVLDPGGGASIVGVRSRGGRRVRCVVTECFGGSARRPSGRRKGRCRRRSGRLLPVKGLCDGPGVIRLGTHLGARLGACRGDRLQLAQGKAGAVVDLSGVLRAQGASDILAGPGEVFQSGLIAGS